MMVNETFGLRSVRLPQSAETHRATSSIDTWAALHFHHLSYDTET
jgi:hypothetical protein